MPRSVNELEYATRRNDILDAAQRLIYTKGYALMTIQDILALLNISKGAFYHYFDSKQAVMDALTERMYQEATALVVLMLADPGLPALVKFHRFFETLSRWKMTQKEFVLGLLHAWYADENTLLRDKVQRRMSERISQMFTAIIAQGVREGVMDTPYPDEAGQVVYQLILGMNDGLAAMLLAPDAYRNRERITQSVVAYTSAIERVLSVAPGSLCLIDSATLGEWIDILSSHTGPPAQDFPPWAEDHSSDSAGGERVN